VTSISVIVPVYNKAQYIGECLNTIIGQTLKDVEILCIDDGSTDDSVKIIRDYAKRNKNIMLICKENTGVGETRNIGIEKATGKYICFIDPDDYYPDSTILKTLYDLAEQKKVQICGGSFSSIRENQIFTDYSYPSEGYKFLKEGFVNYVDYQFDYGFQRFIYQRDLILKNNICFPNYIRYQDPPFFVSCMIFAGIFYAIPMVTYCYREAYKKINWDLSKKIDNLNGMLDCIKIADANNLYKLKERIFFRITSDYYKNIIVRNGSRYEFIVILGILEKMSRYIGAGSKYNDKFSQLFYEISKKIKKEDTCRPTISVIIPVYNVEKYIGPCLDSVLTQELNDIQIICVDDGTEDKSGDICERYANIDSRVTVIHRFNGGLSRARNTGADFADGEYLYFLDSDDMLKNGALQKIYEEMKMGDLDALFFDAETLFESETSGKYKRDFKNTYSGRMGTTDVISGINLLNRMIKNDAYRSPVQLSAVSKKFYVSRGLECYPGILHEDNLYTLEVLVYADRAKYLAEKLYIRRIREDSIMTSKKSFKNFYGYFKCYTKMNEMIQKCDVSETVEPILFIKNKNKKSANVVFEHLSIIERNKINDLSIQDRTLMALDPPFDIPFEWNCVPLLTLITISEEIKQYDLQQSVWDLECFFVKGSFNFHESQIHSREINNLISKIRSKYVILVNQEIKSKTFVANVLKISENMQPTRFSFVTVDGVRALIFINNVSKGELLKSNLFVVEQKKTDTDLLFPFKWLKKITLRIIQKIKKDVPKIDLGYK